MTTLIKIYPYILELHESLQRDPEQPRTAHFASIAALLATLLASLFQ